MADAASPATFDIEAQRVQSQRARVATNTFVAEQHKLMAEAAKLTAEQLKMSAEAAKLGRDRAPAPWQVFLSGMAAGAAFFGAGVPSSASSSAPDRLRSKRGGLEILSSGVRGAQPPTAIAAIATPVMEVADKFVRWL